MMLRHLAGTTGDRGDRGGRGATYQEDVSVRAEHPVVVGSAYCDEGLGRRAANTPVQE
jgi:hypothetical protein